MRKLTSILPKKGGRLRGRVTVRHQGGRHKRFLRHIDFKREKRDVEAKVVSIEYDPNRNANIALLSYSDGDKRYILSPVGLKVGDKVFSSINAPIEPGNSLPLSKMPIGTQVHNLEIRPGKGGQMVRGAGSWASVQGRESTYVLVKMPSGEVRRFLPNAFGTIGQVGNVESKNEVVGKAGRNRRRGIRPTVRGTAQHPAAHPHGGGEGRSGVGLKHPKTVYGKKAVGKTRSRKKYSDKLIVNRRKKGKH